MQLRLPWEALRTATTRPVRQVVVEGRVFPVDVTRRRGARRYVLRVSLDGTLKLTVPWGASIGGGLRFAEGQTDWITREWRRQSARATPWATGDTCWYRGVAVALVADGRHITFADQVIVRRARDTDVRAVVERRVRDIATSELVERCLAFAREKHVPVKTVSVRNQRSRWGACSSRGVITLNWRLLQMPPAVADYVILHELAHIAQANHSRRFWREVERVCPWWRDAERWLRESGKELL